MQTNRIVALHSKLHKVDESYAFASNLLNIIRNQETEGCDNEFDINVQISQLDAQETNMFSDTPKYLKDKMTKLKSNKKQSTKQHTRTHCSS